jgi:Phosphotransferase enzyme family
MFAEWVAEMSPSPLVAPIEVIRERPWAMIAKVPTADGLLWFKENRAQTRGETFLLEALAKWAPDDVLTPIATDHARGWSLQPDGGPTIDRPDAATWERLLSRHADLQRRLTVRTPDMLDAGIPDQRPESLMDVFDRLPVPDEVLALRPVLVAQCAELAASAIPASLQHDDLHGANVFVSGKFFDWGDASVSHPFGVLLISLRVAAEQLGDSVSARLRDAYLEAWSDLADRRALRRDVELATHLGKIGRALAWQRSLVSAEDWAEYGDAIPRWLNQLRA